MLSTNQTQVLSHYCADISKIIIASSVIGFFIPAGPAQVTVPIFVGGLIAASCFLLFSVTLAR